MTARKTECTAERREPCTIVRDGRALTFKFASTMEQAETVVAETRAFFDAAGLALSVGCVTILRELLINAVEHGNKLRQERCVDGSVELLSTPGQVRFVVRDEGDGFAHATRPMSFPADPCALRGRGLALIRSFADRIEFNAKGNEVTVYARNGQEIPCTIMEENGWAVVVPYGNITAAVAGRFCDMLKQLAERGAVRVRLDLGHVKDIDSTGLTAFLLLPRTIRGQGRMPELEAVNVGLDVMNVLLLARLDAVYRIQRLADDKAGV
jgi:anti-sigma regulatory factor (Ser/Thr protein kinase)/ABC-type transporter Mla MlaB component